MRFLACLLAAAALVPAATASGAAGGWTSHRSVAGGFEVSTPTTWIDLTRLTPQVLARVRSLPALQPYVAVIRTSKVVKLLVADAGATSIANGYASNLNVVQAPTIGDLRFQRDATVAALRSSGVAVGPVRAAYVSLPAGRAVSLTYRARFGASLPVVAVQQFAFVRSGKATILTYTTLPTLRTRYAAVFTQSARSFRFA